MVRMRKSIGRLLAASLVTVACVFGSLISLDSLTPAAAADGTRDITLGTSGISGYSEMYGYNYIYFGKYNSQPVLWRVLSTNGSSTDNGTASYKDNGGTKVDASDAIFMLSEYMLDSIIFNVDPNTSSNKGTSGATWIGSQARSWANTTFPNKALTDQEKAALLATSKTDKDYQVAGTTETSYKFKASTITDDKLFFLSVAEISNEDWGFTDGTGVGIGDSRGTCVISSSGACTTVRNYRGYWLRGAKASSPNNDSVATIYRLNSDYITESHVVYLEYNTRPGTNLNSNQVLFSTKLSALSSSTVGRLSAIGTSSATSSEGATDSNTWRLVLEDKTRSDFTASVVTTKTTTTGIMLNGVQVKAGAGVQINYSGATAGDDEYISAVITNKSDEVIYYGRIGTASSASGSVTFTLPSDIAKGDYKLLIFNEQYTEETSTGYSSDFQTASVTYGDVSIAASPDLYIRVAGNDAANVNQSGVGIDFANSTALAGVTIELTRLADNETFTGTTGADGYAKFEDAYTSGTQNYQITSVSYAADSDTQSLLQQVVGAKLATYVTSGYVYNFTNDADRKLNWNGTGSDAYPAEAEGTAGTWTLIYSTQAVGSGDDEGGSGDSSETEVNLPRTGGNFGLYLVEILGIGVLIAIGGSTVKRRAAD